MQKALRLSSPFLFVSSCSTFMFRSILPYSLSLANPFIAVTRTFVNTSTKPRLPDYLPWTMHWPFSDIWSITLQLCASLRIYSYRQFKPTPATIIPTKLETCRSIVIYDLIQNSTRENRLSKRPIPRRTFSFSLQRVDRIPS